MIDDMLGAYGRRCPEVEAQLYEDLRCLDVVASEVYCFESVSSTMDVAKGMIVSGNPLDGTVIIAQQQTNGRGRFDRSWFSPEGGVWLSIITYSGQEDNYSGLLSLVAGIASCKTIKDHLRAASIKWVNDMVCNNKKLCGVLVEGRKGYNVVGIGVDTNVKEFPKELADISTSIFLEGGVELDNIQFIKNLLTNFEEQYERFRQGGYEEIVQEYKSLTSSLERDVLISINGGSYPARTVDIDETGALIVLANEQRKRIIEGEIRYLD